MEEVEHITEILTSAQRALINEDSLKLRDLSNQTIHCASKVQDNGSILIAVLMYSLSKLLERKKYLKIKNWDVLIKKINSLFSLAIQVAKQNDEKRYEEYLEMVRKTLNSSSLNIKPFIQDVLRKASINKGSKIYEHGISLGQTSKLLGITQWELIEYIGQTSVNENEQNNSIDIRKRIEMALEFFS